MRTSRSIHWTMFWFFLSFIQMLSVLPSALAKEESAVQDIWIDLESRQVAGSQEELKEKGVSLDQLVASKASFLQSSLMMFAVIAPLTMAFLFTHEYLTWLVLSITTGQLCAGAVIIGLLYGVKFLLWPLMAESKPVQLFIQTGYGLIVWLSEIGTGYFWRQDVDDLVMF